MRKMKGLVELVNIVAYFLFAVGNTFNHNMLLLIGFILVIVCSAVEVALFTKTYRKKHLIEKRTIIYVTLNVLYICLFSSLI